MPFYFRYLHHIGSKCFWSISTFVSPEPVIFSLKLLMPNDLLMFIVINLIKRNVNIEENALVL